MDIIDRIKKLSEKAKSIGYSLETEEATKTALVLPFLQSIWGYDVFNPLEVIPEFTADAGSKKGEKVDYALVNNNEVRMLIECKAFTDNLNSEKHKVQLFRYFSVTKAKVGVLTNGVKYEFYTDLETSNLMDDKPFMTLDLLNLDENIIPEIKKLHKDSFDVDSILSVAGDLKYVKEIKKVLTQQFENPEEDFIKFFISKVYDGIQTPKVKNQFSEIVSKSLKHFLNDSINKRLQLAINGNVNVKMTDSESTIEEDIIEKESKIDTTIEEMDAFSIIKAILRKEFEISRIVGRDTQSYFGILLDDNNRKPLCRLHFNTKQKYIGIIDENKKETKIPIESLDDIYELSETIIKNAERYK